VSGTSPAGRPSPEQASATLTGDSRTCSVRPALWRFPNTGGCGEVAKLITVDRIKILEPSSASAPPGHAVLELYIGTVPLRFSAPVERLMAALGGATALRARSSRLPRAKIIQSAKFATGQFKNSHFGAVRSLVANWQKPV